MMRATSLLAAAALSVATVAAAAASEEAAAPRPNVTFVGVPRSVEKEMLALNATGKKFQCLDDRKTQIPFDKFNDNYCDCPNGADEPGTGACAPQGRFYCRNKGYIGMYIPSSRVNDTVCDCCDGSDESSPRVQCPNNCAEIAEAARAARAEQIAVFEAGAAKKKEYAQQGAAAAEARLAEMAAARAKLVAEENRKKEATKAKEVAEAAEKDEREAKLASRLAQLKDGVGYASLNKEGMKELYEKLKGRHGKVVGALLSELRTKLGIKEEAAAAAKADEEEEDEPEEDEEEYDEEEDDGGDLAATLDAVAALGEEKEGEKDEKDAGLEALLEEVEEGVVAETEAAKAARTEFYAAQAAEREAEKKVEELEALEKEDFGDDQEFGALKDKCFSKKVAQYTYELCPYKEAYQKEGSNSHGTSLGKWKGMERVPAAADGSTPATFIFKFRDGQQCWNGPKRSLTVAVSCGTEDEVVGVDEPSMCEYAMEFRTPAACAPLPDHLRLDLAWENEEDEEEEGSPRTEL